MDYDFESLPKDQAVIDTVEIEDAETANPSISGYDGAYSPPPSHILPSAIYETASGPLHVTKSSLRYQQDDLLSDDELMSNSVAPSSCLVDPLTYIRPKSPDIILPPRYAPLPYSTSKSGLTYDVSMLLHRHLKDSHPEQPSRISAIYDMFVDGGLVAKSPELENEYHLLRLPFRPALEPDILLVHSAEHIAWVKVLAETPIEVLKDITVVREHRDSVYVHPNTYFAAVMAAGGATEAARQVVCGTVRNAIAVVRPPGHHAEHNLASGFCFFNNVCVATKVVQRDFKDLCRKVLILDWDVHHGNGVQHCFEDDPNVLYISLHLYEGGTFYPEGPDGDHFHCGKDKGLGRNINIPWPTKGMGDAEYIYAFQQVVMPVAIEFDPDLVVISAGFDAADGDSIGGCYISPAGYSHMTHMLMQLAKGKVVACLEGGYGFEAGGVWNPSPVAKSALAVARTLMGEPPERLGDLTLHQSAVKIVQAVIRVQSKFWNCLYPKDLELIRKTQLGSQRLHDIIREWQSKRLWEEHKMSALFIMREKLSKSFENQVLATPNYHEARPLLVIFHDPPEALGYPDPRTSQLELHNTWITDVSKTYVDWAAKHDFAVIDVNIPKYVTEVVDETGHEDGAREMERSQATLEVAQYLWRNYIETGDSTHLFLLGIGDAYVGIVELLTRYDTAVRPVTHTFAFVADNVLRRVDRPSDEGTPLVNQYYKTSSIFVSPEHQAWDSTHKKLSKRFGRLVKSSATDLQEMLLAHRSEVTDTLIALTKGSGSQVPPAVTGQSALGEDTRRTMTLHRLDLANGHMPLAGGLAHQDVDMNVI